MKIKKLVKIFAMTLVVIMTVGSFIACGGRDSIIDDVNSSVDETKTQLYVGYYDAGFGREWILQAKDLFERENKDTVFENGKKGIQVMLDLDKAGLNGGDLLETMASKRDQIFFIENGDMHRFIDRGLIKEITNIVKSKVDGESKTIEDKLTYNSKDYYNVGGKYYAMPYYEGMLGINFNIELFKERGYYFAYGKNADNFDFENGDLNDLFIKDPKDQKSKGPDNIEGTYDDGLPATYADFRALIMKIGTTEDTPMIWCGSYLTYLVEFMNAVWADFEGYDQMMLNWSMNGTATDLIEVDSKGAIKRLEPTVIRDGDQGYMLQKQEGKYRALQFAKIMVESSENYYKDSFSSSLTHIDAQRRFVKAGQNSYGNIAMLIDGNWWDVEATSQFDSNPDSKYSKLKMDFGFMPIPKVDMAHVESADNARTLLTLNSSMTFINANTSEQMLPAAEAFFKFVHSDRVMNILSKCSNMMRPFNYELTNETLNGMSTYGKEMYRIHQEAQKTHLGTAEYKIYIQDCYPTTSSAIAHSDLINPKTWGWSNSDGKVNPVQVFKEKSSMTAEDYFTKLCNNYRGSWGEKWGS